MMELHLVRHGRTFANEKWLYCGQTDVPLTESGKAELITLKNQGIYPPPADMFFTSGLCRAEQTVDAIYGSVLRTPIPDIAEYNFGVFEMKSHEELKERENYQAWITDETGTVPCPGGESKVQFNKRILGGYSHILNSALHSGCNSVFVLSHGGTIACIMEFLRPKIKNIYEWLPQSGRGYSLSYISGQLSVYKPI